MAKRQIHYKSVEYFRLKFIRSIIIALIVFIISMFPLVLMLNVLHKGSTLFTVLIGLCLAGFFALQIRTNYKIWKDKEKEEAAKHKKVHKKAPIKKK